MFRKLKNFMKWSSGNSHTHKQNNYHLIKCLLKLLEDILLWENKWLSLAFILYINIIFFICLHRSINVLQLVIAICIVLIGIDAFEAWLKYKHRNSFLQRLTPYDSIKLYQATVRFDLWIKKRWSQFVILRETNHAKGFLIANIILGSIYTIGKSISGYLLMYLLCMGACVAHLIIPYIKQVIKKIKQHAESDTELDSLIPDVSDQDMKDLAFELNPASSKKKSIDYYKLDDLQPEESSDSSDTGSLVSLLSKEKLQTLDKHVDSSSESSEDEYMPRVPDKVHHEKLKSTIEIVERETWGETAMSMLRTMTGAFAYRAVATRAPQRIPSADSSDGFELIDENDTL